MCVCTRTRRHARRNTRLHAPTTYAQGHTSLGICVSHVGETHISRDMCAGTRISRGHTYHCDTGLRLLCTVEGHLPESPRAWSEDQGVEMLFCYELSVTVLTVRKYTLPASKWKLLGSYHDHPPSPTPRLSWESPNGTESLVTTMPTFPHNPLD